MAVEEELLAGGSGARALLLYKELNVGQRLGPAAVPPPHVLLDMDRLALLAPRDDLLRPVVEPRLRRAAEPALVEGVHVDGIWGRGETVKVRVVALYVLRKAVHEEHVRLGFDIGREPLYC